MRDSIGRRVDSREAGAETNSHAAPSSCVSRRLLCDPIRAFVGLGAGRVGGRELSRAKSGEVLADSPGRMRRSAGSRLSKAARVRSRHVPRRFRPADEPGFVSTTENPLRASATSGSLTHVGLARRSTMTCTHVIVPTPTHYFAQVGPRGQTGAQMHGRGAVEHMLARSEVRRTPVSGESHAYRGVGAATTRQSGEPRLALDASSRATGGPFELGGVLGPRGNNQHAMQHRCRQQATGHGHQLPTSLDRTFASLTSPEKKQ